MHDLLQGSGSGLSPRRGRKLQRGSGDAGLQAHTPGERESLELGRWRPICITALGPSRTDKNGVRSLDPKSASGVAGFFLCIAEENVLELESQQLPQIRQPFNKNLFPSPTYIVLRLCAAADG